MCNLCRLISAAIILLLLAQAADAKSMSYRLSRYRAVETPEMNNWRSARYDRLLQTSPHFRAYRMWKECHTINFSQELYNSCIGSFDRFTPILR